MVQLGETGLVDGFNHSQQLLAEGLGSQGNQGYKRGQESGPRVLFFISKASYLP